MKTRGNFVLMLVLSVVFLCVPIGVSRADYPERPITWIVNTTPGGGADLSNRALAKYAEKVLGQPIMVVNKPGAGGTLATGILATAKPDGYTIGDTTFSPLAIGSQMIEVTYDPLKDFEYIMGYGQWMYGFLVKADSPFKTFQDIVTYAKANPGKIKISVYAQASPHGLVAAAMEKAAGIKWDVVVFKGGVEAMTAVLGGHVDANSQVADIAVPQIKSGKVRLLASTSDTRWKWVPDVPTLKEVGYNVAVTAYLGTGAPKGVPKPVLDKLRSVLEKAMADPEFLQVMENFYLKVQYRSPEEYRKIIEDGYRDYGKFAMEIGVHKSQQKK